MVANSESHMSIKIIVNGAAGKMGRLACQAIDNHPELVLAAGLTRDDNLLEVIEQTGASVVVDLTRADCVYANALAIIEGGAYPVIGTSGLQPSEIQHLKTLCEKKQLGGLIVPNFSIGAVLMMRFSEETARYLTNVEIIEAHHPQKFDAPSGTAIRTAEMIARARQTMTNKIFNKTENSSEKNIYPGARGASCFDVPIHSLRLEGVLAEQQVIFGNTGETLTLSHRSQDRQCFMPGLLLCCEKVVTLKTLCEGLETIL